MHFRRIAIGIAALALACASELTRQPTSFNPIQGTDGRTELMLRQNLQVTPVSGFARMIKAGSHWKRAGSTPQGDVYRPVNDVFTLEGANVHEAYLVVAGKQLVGFYLPGETAFAPLATPVSLPTE